MQMCQAFLKKMLPDLQGITRSRFSFKLQIKKNEFVTLLYMIVYLHLNIYCFVTGQEVPSLARPPVSSDRAGLCRPSPYLPL